MDGLGVFTEPKDGQWGVEGQSRRKTRASPKRPTGILLYDYPARDPMGEVQRDAKF